MSPCYGTIPVGTVPFPPPLRGQKIPAIMAHLVTGSLQSVQLMEVMSNPLSNRMAMQELWLGVKVKVNLVVSPRVPTARYIVAGHHQHHPYNSKSRIVERAPIYLPDWRLERRFLPSLVGSFLPKNSVPVRGKAPTTPEPAAEIENDPFRRVSRVSLNDNVT